MKIDKITPQILSCYCGSYAQFYGASDYWQIYSVGESGAVVLKNGLYTQVIHEDNLFVEYDLHLRRLESITEEEAIHIHNDVIGFDYSGIIPCRDWICLGFDGNSSFYQDARGYPTAWLYLLSRGFDLFGLIDAGLAKEIQPK